MISDFVQRLLDPVGLTPHGFCLLWEPWLIWTHALSNIFIGLAYFSIPVTLLYFARRRHDLVFRPVFALFAAFIVLCGAGHWADLLTIWWPFYGAEALIKAATAAVSVATAAVLWRLLPSLLALPSPAQLRAANETLRQAEDHLRHTVELNPQVPWTADPDGRITSVGKRWFEVTGLAPEEALSEDGWARLAHPADRTSLETTWRHAISTCEPLDVEARLRVADGSYRWWRIRSSPRRDEAASGQVVRWYGAAEDIHERRATEERQMLLAREVDHRAKNALAVVLSMLRLTPQNDPMRFAATVEGRVAAMARAHSLLSKEKWAGADLRTLVEDELAAHAGRVVLSGPPARLTPEAAQPVAMLLHELATKGSSTDK